MIDIIKDEGGFVDKYIDDAIVAVFGAPLHDAAQGAALTGQARGENRILDSGRTRPLGQRIGLDSEEVLVGTVGSRRRFNSVRRDCVESGVKPEGAKKFFVTTILASEVTRSMAGDELAWRDIDSVRVKGRDQRCGFTTRSMPRMLGGSSSRTEARRVGGRAVLPYRLQPSPWS